MAEGTTILKKRAPMLYVIIAIKVVKGVMLLLLAFGVYHLSDRDRPEVFRQALLFFHLDPEKRFLVELTDKIEMISEAGMVRVASGTALYSLFSLVEGVGLIFRVPWAGWLAIGESAFFIPIEIHELMNRPSAAVFVILGLNVMIVWYLFQNRHRLFRHHRPRH